MYYVSSANTFLQAVFLLYSLTHPSGQGEQLAADPKENSVGELTPHRSSVPSPTQKYPVLQPRHLGLVTESKAKNKNKNQRIRKTTRDTRAYIV